MYLDLSIHFLYVGCKYVVELTKPDAYVEQIVLKLGSNEQDIIKGHTPKVVLLEPLNTTRNFVIRLKSFNTP